MARVCERRGCRPSTEHDGCRSHPDRLSEQHGVPRPCLSLPCTSALEQYTIPHIEYQIVWKSRLGLEEVEKGSEKAWQTFWPCCSQVWFDDRCVT